MLRLEVIVTLLCFSDAVHNVLHTGDFREARSHQIPSSILEAKPTQKLGRLNSVALVVVHSGWQPYVCATMKQLDRMTDPATKRLIWIAPEDEQLKGTPQEFQDSQATCNLPSRVERYSGAQLMDQDIQKFRELYVHWSPNSIEYERACFERWMFVASAVKKLDITGSLMILDSDLLITRPLDDFLKYMASYEFVSDIGYKVLIPALTYFRYASDLEDLKLHFLDAYTGSADEVTAKLTKIATPLPTSPGGMLISDMYMLYSFVDRFYGYPSDRVFSSSHFFPDGSKNLLESCRLTNNEFHLDMNDNLPTLSVRFYFQDNLLHKINAMHFPQQSKAVLMKFFEMSDKDRHFFPGSADAVEMGNFSVLCPDMEKPPTNAQ